MSQIESYFLKHPEPIKSCMLALRHFILTQNPNITAEWKYGMPFFCFHRKMLCYLWLDQKRQQPYIGIVDGKHIDHASLLQGKRSRMKIMLFDPLADLPTDAIREVLTQALELHRKAKIDLTQK